MYAFGPFRLEPAERRLLREGRAIALTPKAFDLLVILVKNAGHLLKKEDLLEQLWPGVFVEEVNLAQNVSLIRRVLGGQDRGAYIQTVTGVGYRFVVPVHSAAAALELPAGPPATTKSSRLIVLPFRVLKADGDIDFLSFSLPDALSASLSNLESLVVRSSLVASRFAGETPDLTKIAAEADVTLVLTGTLLRSGDQLRVTTQLVEAPAGTLIWSHTAEAVLGDLFRLQDSLVNRIVESLELPLTAREQRLLTRDVPASAKAYEYFLRANQISSGARWWTNVATWTLARDLYVRCLEEDPRFAPAWAALGRVYRFIAKYVPENSGDNFARAEHAFTRALELNPDLAIAQSLYAQLEIDVGRARGAMMRLLDLVRVRATDASLFAALCHACRYCGLLDASVAAHERAVQLDSTILTSVVHTYYLLGDYERVVDLAVRQWGGYGSIGLIALAEIGRADEAVRAAAATADTAPPLMRALITAARGIIEGRYAECIPPLEEAAAATIDPETRFYCARQFARIGERRRALDLLARVAAGGYSCYAAIERDRWFDPLRDDPAFQEIEARLREIQQDMVRAFTDAGGPAVVGASKTAAAASLTEPS